MPNIITPARMIFHVASVSNNGNIRIPGLQLLAIFELINRVEMETCVVNKLTRHIKNHWSFCVLCFVPVLSFYVLYRFIVQGRALASLSSQARPMHITFTKLTRVLWLNPLSVVGSSMLPFLTISLSFIITTTTIHESCSFTIVPNLCFAGSK